MTEYSPIQRTLEIQWTRNLDGTWEADLSPRWGVAWSPEDVRWIASHLRAAADHIERRSGRPSILDDVRRLHAERIAQAWPKCPVDPAHLLVEHRREQTDGLTARVWWCLACEGYIRLK